MPADLHRFARAVRRSVLLLVAAVAALLIGVSSASAAVSFVGTNSGSGTAAFFGSATASVSVPAGTANGDLMIAAASTASNGGWTSTGFTAPSGWTQLDSVTSSSTQAFYYKVANNESGSYSWSYAYPGGGGGASVVATIDTYTGVNSASPITAGNTAQGTTTSVTLPNDTATMAGSMRVSLIGTYSTSTGNTPTATYSGLTLTNHKEATTGAGVHVSAAYVAQNAGATTSTTATLSKTPTRWFAGTYVLNPAVPTKVAFTTDPVAGVAEGVAFPTQPVVKVQYASGATATGDTSSVTLAIASGPAGGVLTCTGGLTKAAVAGVASFAGCMITGTQAAGAYTITATDGSLTSDTSNSFTIVVGAAAKVTFTTNPVGGVAEGTALPTQPVVAVQDAYGNTVTGNTSSVTLSIASGPGSGVLTCTANPKAATAGVVSFAGCQITGTAAAGTYTLVATDGALATDTSTSFTINVGAATKLAFTTQPVGGVAEGVALPTQPVVTVQDAYGNTVTGSAASVQLAIASGPGAGLLSCTANPQAASAGTASFAACQITGTQAAGTYTINATSAGLTTAVSTSFVITAGAATKLAFTVQPVGGVNENVAFPTQPTVAVQDAYGNTVTSDTSSVTLAIASGPGSGVLTCTANPKAAAAGVDAFAGCKITGTAAAGTYTLTATDGALTAATSSSFTITYGAAAKLAFTTQPVGGVAPTIALPTQPVVTVQDAYGNTVLSDTSNVTLSLATNPGGTLSCAANPKAAVAGVATFSTCRINGAVGTYALGAADGALTGATSSGFTIIAGSLAIATSSYAFSGVTLNGADQLPTANLPLNIADTTGSGAGWRVTASATAWTGGSSGTLSSAQRVMAPPSATCDNGAGTCTLATTGGTLTYPVVMSSTPTVVYNATAGTGTGPQTVNLPMTLPIPGGLQALGSFSQAVTLSVTSGP